MRRLTADEGVHERRRGLLVGCAPRHVVEEVGAEGAQLGLLARVGEGREPLRVAGRGVARQCLVEPDGAGEPGVEGAA